MDFESHMRLADNALIAVDNLIKEYDGSSAMGINLLHFAHTMRLHYEYTSLDKKDVEYINRLKKADLKLLEVCDLLHLNDTKNLILKSEYEE